MSNRLGGKQGTAYTGTNANQPPNWTFNNRPPTQYDTQNVSVGDLWLDSSAAGIEKVWVLVSLAGDMVSKGSLAQWEQLGSGALETLTGNVGGPVGPDANDNVNVIGDAVTINVVGTPVNNTLTISTTGAVATQYTTDAGVAVPAAGNLNVLGVHNINTSGAGSTVSVNGNNAITLGDLADISLTPAITVASGNIDLTDPNQSQNPATNQTIRFNTNTGQNGIISMFLNNVVMGPRAMDGATPTAGVTLFNTGIGTDVFRVLNNGERNSCIGHGALTSITNGVGNTCAGYTAGGGITTGSTNIFIGHEAGNSVTTGSNNIVLESVPAAGIDGTDSNNILIGANGTSGDNNTLRIGEATGAGANQLNRAFISGIRGITTGVNDAVAVLIDSAGQLGTTSSSIRYKENVKDMGDCSSALMSLRPVTFNYKEDVDKSKAYGLIAEEVAEIFPDLVVYNPEGQIETVKYHLLAPILLNEVQKLSKRIEQLESKLRE